MTDGLPAQPSSTPANAAHRPTATAMDHRGLARARLRFALDPRGRDLLARFHAAFDDNTA